MAPGRIHTETNYRLLQLLSVVAVAVAFLGYPLPAGAVMAGAFGGYLAGPDLDQSGVTEDELRWYRLHPLLGFLFHAYWLPYSLIPHRSKWSHLPGLASALRMAYALALPGALWLWAGYPLPWATLAWMWAGWTAMDANHLRLDGWRLR